MIDELPAAPDPVTDTPDVFSQKAAAFVLAQKAMVPQMNVTAANVNSAANGAAFSIPYKFLTSTLNNGSAAGGVMSFTASQILVDVKSSAGALVTNSLAAGGASTSVIKSYLRIINAADPSKWATYSVSSYALAAGGLYGVFNVTLVDRTSSTPFANNDAVILSITPNGDKGDVGPTPSALTPTLHVTHTQASGTGAGNATGVGVTYTRVLNTVVKNTITGASLASNQITLPAGTYRVLATVPANAAAQQQAWLYNVTTASNILSGSSAYETSGASVSVLMREITLSAQSTLEVRQFISSSSATLGTASGAGIGEVYTQIIFEKVA